LPALAGCATPVPPALRAPVLPTDPAITFQALLAGQPVPPLTAPDSPWQISVDPPGSIEIAGDAVRIVSPPGVRAWISPRLPLTPLNAARPGQLEDLNWDATVDNARRFFVACELRFAGEPGAILIQVTPFDLQVLHDSARPQGGRSESVSRLAGDGQEHFWRLRVDDAGLQLRLDGSIVWSMAGKRSLSRVAFGETRSDLEHGGAMLLRNLVYVRRPA